MATHETPLRHEDHYIIENDSTSSSNGFWAVFAAILVLLALIFGAVFLNRNRTANQETNVNDSVKTQSDPYHGSGTIQIQ